MKGSVFEMYFVDPLPVFLMIQFKSQKPILKLFLTNVSN